MPRHSLLPILALLLLANLFASFTIVSYNVENLFDCRHDTLKDDHEFLPDGVRRWTNGRLWKKLNDVGRVIHQCGEGNGVDGPDGSTYHLPDVVALLEVENDSVLRRLTMQSVLRGAAYRYVVTQSPDRRGVDVALLYNPLTLQPLTHRYIRITPPHGAKPTRDILYLAGRRTIEDDTLHLFVVHAPSRSGGQAETEPYRLLVAQQLLAHVDSIRSDNPHACIVVMGDFNDYSTDRSLQLLTQHHLTEASRNLKGKDYARTHVSGTYRYQGAWGSLDHIFVSPPLTGHIRRCYILDNPWMLEQDTDGQYKPFRTYLGTLYHGGISDHLPIVLEME